MVTEPPNQNMYHYVSKGQHDMSGALSKPMIMATK